MGARNGALINLESQSVEGAWMRCKAIGEAKLRYFSPLGAGN